MFLDNKILTELYIDKLLDWIFPFHTEPIFLFFCDLGCWFLMTILIFNVRAELCWRLVVRRPRDTIQCAGLYQPSIYNQDTVGGGGADQENCGE